ncbi:hypothetical protein L218DRAFT_50776 [Marasmius fiardii PR-910]|nr:hypothetical protein L218DRAFT_50776 [Marasmius fiardii PR-910]
MNPKSIAEHDEYEEFDDFAHWTQADFDVLDAQLASSQSKGLPQVPVELDFGLDSNMVKPSPFRRLPPHLSSRTGSTLDQNSPLQRFRRTRHLSVTDLVSPVWCEYQFDYGLRQKRHKKLSERPDSFVTKAGKEIQVEKPIAAKNEVQLNKGKAVHKKLEREIHPEDVIVPVDTKEDGWGLRLLNMVTGFRTLLRLGCARELPVFGIIKGHVVVGIIVCLFPTHSLCTSDNQQDEVLRTQINHDFPSSLSKRPPQSNPTTPRKPKRSRTSPDLPTCGIAHDFGNSKSVVSLSSAIVANTQLPSTPVDHYILHLNDTKTRRSDTLPSDDDALSSRLQLMTYYRLLSNLLAHFDFPLLWTKEQVNPSRKFSQSFLSEAGLGDMGSYEVTCLDDLTALWHATLLELRVAHVDARLTLVYRSRQSPRNKRKKEQGKARGKAPELEFISPREQADIDRAIEASLQDLVATYKPSTSSGGAGPELLDDDIFLRAQQQSHLQCLSKNSTEDEGKTLRDQCDAGSSSEVQAPSTLSYSEEGSTDASHISEVLHSIKESSATEGETDASIIGTKEFIYSASLLDNHLRDVMSWWEGYREPRGVSLEQAWRCSKCEYRQGCEWREQKALEFCKKPLNGQRIADIDRKVVELGDQV